MTIVKCYIPTACVKVKRRRSVLFVVWMSGCRQIRRASVSDQPVLDQFQEVILSGMSEILPADKAEESRHWRSGNIWIPQRNERKRGHELIGLVTSGHVTGDLEAVWPQFNQFCHSYFSSLLSGFTKEQKKTNMIKRFGEPIVDLI